MALFMSAIPVSGVLGGPFSGSILGHFAAGQGSLAAWQWLFLLQGLPTVVLGIGMLFILNDGIAHATWLPANERSMLEQALIDDEKNQPTTVADSFGAVLKNPGVWTLGAIYFCIQSGVYAINFWLPSIIKASGSTDPNLIGWQVLFLWSTVVLLHSRGPRSNACVARRAAYLKRCHIRYRVDLLNNVLPPIQFNTMPAIAKTIDAIVLRK